MLVLFLLTIPVRYCTAGVTFRGHMEQPPPGFQPWEALHPTRSLSWHPPALGASALTAAPSCHTSQAMPDAWRGERSLSLPLT